MGQALCQCCVVCIHVYVYTHMCAHVCIYANVNVCGVKSITNTFWFLHLEPIVV